MLWVGISIGLLGGAALGWAFGLARGRRQVENAIHEWQSRLNVRDRELRSARAKVTQAEQERELLQKEMEEAMVQVEQAKKRTAKAFHFAQELKGVRAQLEDQLEALSRDLADSHQSVNDAHRELGEQVERTTAVQEELRQANTQLAARESDVQRLRGQLREVDRLRKQMDDQESRSIRRENRDRQDLMEREGQIGILCQRIKELEELEPRLQESTRRLEELEPLAERIEQLEQERQILQQQRDEAQLKFELGPDDLKQIKGVGAKLEQKLHALGLSSFESIAMLRPEQIEEISAQLKFNKRIQRDAWIEQARELYTTKYGRAL